MRPNKTIKIGRSDFGRIVRGNHYFVDKTKFISEFYNDASDIIVMPRPKRFGKTLNLSMLEHFFDIRKPESKALFEEYEIAKDKEFCEKHQNKYPVINLTLKSVEGDDWESCYDKLQVVVSGLYKSHKYLLASDKIDDFEKDTFKQIMYKKASAAELSFSLQMLSEYLRRHFSKEVIILIDEYDAPIIHAFEKTNPPIKSLDKEKPTYYQKIVGFMQMFLGETFKGNEDNLEKGLLTGVMRISRESLFSKWNNITVFDIQMPYFTDSFGFTNAEIKQILQYFNLQDKFDGVKKWYDGYKFGNIENIYNPWSIMRYISLHNVGFKPYWINSSENSLIQNRITEAGAKEAVEQLILGQKVVKEIRENFVFEDFETDNDLLWTLLFYSGFLTQVEQVSTNYYALRIPNNEIKTAFIHIILKWVKQKYRLTKDGLKNTFNYLITNDLANFEKELRKSIADSLSFYDTATKADKSDDNYRSRKEQIFHVYTLGMLAALKDDYVIKSNRESGAGRYDIMLIPNDKDKNGVVIEIKSIEKQKANESDADFANRINTALKNARRQIERNQYQNELLAHKISEDKIVKVAIVFAGKLPYVNEVELKKTTI